GPCWRALPLAGPDGQSNGAPIATDNKGRGKTDHPIRRVDLAVWIENEREGQVQVLRVPPNRFPVLAGVDSKDGEAPRCEFAVEPLQRRHLRATFATPARPEVDEKHLPPEISHRNPPGFERVAAEERRCRTGGI